MIFKLHYFSFNAGLSGVLVLITVFLRKYSDASSTEVGTLLMVLPFMAVFTKPFFCALADRHRRYRLYFILALFFTLLGFGSYTLLPFYPQYVASHGRTCWWLLVAATVIGYIAYGVVWSLGDAYAANVAHRTGESFGMIRLWGTVGWGVAGALVGAASPYFELPEMVLGFLVFIVTHVFEILLLIWWPNKADFEMGDVPAIEETLPNKLATISEKPTMQQQQVIDGVKSASIELAAAQLKSGELKICRTPSNSLAILTKLKLEPANQTTLDSRNTTEAAFVDLERNLGQLLATCKGSEAAAIGHQAQQISKAELERKEARKQIAELQMVIFRMLARKHKSLLKYLVIFVALGTVYNIHWSYFFLHLEQLASEHKGADFSTLVGLCLVAQAIGETFCFAIAPWVVSKLGRDGAISLNAIAFAVRYFGNGLGIPLVSPYVAILTESLQGINYGIFYYLITDTALHYALLVDDVLPELLSRGLLSERANLNEVRTSLRATMQGVFSGAFDGLGFGLGSLIAGLVLEAHTYEQLWCFAGAGALVIFALHASFECLTRLQGKGNGDLLAKMQGSYKRQIKHQLHRANAAAQTTQTTTILALDSK